MSKKKDVKEVISVKVPKEEKVKKTKLIESDDDIKKLTVGYKIG